MVGEFRKGKRRPVDSVPDNPALGNSVLESLDIVRNVADMGAGYVFLRNDVVRRPGGGEAS